MNALRKVSIRYWLITLAALLSFGLCATCFVGFRGPRIDVSATVDEEGRVVFDMPYSGIFSVNSFIVKDENGDPMWKIDSLHGKKENWQKLTYGVLPPQYKPYSPPRQEFPADNQPPRDIRGKTIYVVVQYTYDDFSHPSSGTFEKWVVVP